jgi:hypothetical protein
MPEAPANPATARQSDNLLPMARGMGGALLGAASGVLVFMLLGRLGLYAVAAIGVLTGLGCSYFSQRRSVVLGVLSLAIALMVTFFNEWWNNHFLEDPSLVFFVQNLTKVNGVFWLSLLLGGGLAFWLGMGNERTSPRAGP